MSGPSKISAVVVTFNPDIEVLINSIESYINSVDNVFIVDNSTVIWEYTRLSEISKINIIKLYGNKGIAYALNIGCTTAIEQGANYILTMDQDTIFSFPIETFPIEKFNDKIMAIVPNWSGSKGIDYAIVHNAIQSGALFSKKAINEIGLFNTDYFIDYVDYEYFKRGKNLGYSILQSNIITLNHKNGELYQGQFLFWKYNYKFSSPLRLYYQTRNGIDYISKFKDYRQYIVIIKMILKTLLVANKKRIRLLYIWKGFRDWNNKKWGIYNE